jgi:hypothetical protein
VITAVSVRKPGLGGDNLVRDNHEIVKHTAEECVRYPLQRPDNRSAGRDVLRHRVSRQFSQKSRGSVHTFFAVELNLSVEDIGSAVLGMHGNSVVSPSATHRPGRYRPYRPTDDRKGVRRSCAICGQASLSMCPAPLNSSSFRPVLAVGVVVRRPTHSQLLNHGAH